MNHELPGNSPEQQAIRILEKAAKNDRYSQYAEGRGPLTVGEIDPAIATSDDFLDILATYEWPSPLDATIEPPFEYGAAQDFVTCLRGDSDKGPYLNNLNAFFASTPTNEFVTHNMYGSAPVMHRAYAIAPDLFSGIHDLYASSRPVVDRANLSRIMKENTGVATSLYNAFFVLSRLIKVGDQDTHMKMIDKNDKADPVVSAQRYLET